MIAGARIRAMIAIAEEIGRTMDGLLASGDRFQLADSEHFKDETTYVR
jgi:hypothetical protein